MFQLMFLGGLIVLLMGLLLGIAASAPSWLLPRIKLALVVAGVALAADGYLVLAAGGLYQ